MPEPRETHAAIDARRNAQRPPKAKPTCPRCGSPRWVSVSLDGGWTRHAQCVPCGAYHKPMIGPGWKSARFNDPEAEHPDYRKVPSDPATDTGGEGHG